LSVPSIIYLFNHLFMSIGAHEYLFYTLSCNSKLP
jgi:hypothetical protein